MLGELSSRLRGFVFDIPQGLDPAREPGPDIVVGCGVDIYDGLHGGLSLLSGPLGSKGSYTTFSLAIPKPDRGYSATNRGTENSKSGREDNANQSLVKEIEMHF